MATALDWRASPVALTDLDGQQSLARAYEQTRAVELLPLLSALLARLIDEPEAAQGWLDVARDGDPPDRFSRLRVADWNGARTQADILLLQGRSDDLLSWIDQVPAESGHSRRLEDWGRGGNSLQPGWEVAQGWGHLEPWEAQMFKGTALLDLSLEEPDADESTSLRLRALEPLRQFIQEVEQGAGYDPVDASYEGAVRLGVAMLSLGRNDDAAEFLADLEEALAREPGHTLSYVPGRLTAARGLVRAMRGDPDGAVQLFEQARQEGFTPASYYDLFWVTSDPFGVYNGLAERPDFQALVEELAAENAATRERVRQEIPWVLEPLGRDAPTVEVPVARDP